MKANEVLENVNKYIVTTETIKQKMGYSKKWLIREHCSQLGIFDWWNEWLSLSQLKQMKKFLETAIALGYTGYVCFKVGAAGCSHGMWAYKKDSEDGYSPKDGGCLHHSFRSGDNYYDLQFEDGKWLGNNEKWQFTLKEIKEAINNK